MFNLGFLWRGRHIMGDISRVDPDHLDTLVFGNGKFDRRAAGGFQNNSTLHSV